MGWHPPLLEDEWGAHVPDFSVPNQSEGGWALARAGNPPALSGSTTYWCEEIALGLLAA